MRTKIIWLVFGSLTVAVLVLTSCSAVATEAAVQSKEKIVTCPQ